MKKILLTGICSPSLTFFLTLSMAIFTLPALGQETDETIAAYSAGYKAAFTCSATFNAGKTPDQIEAQELTGIYRAYQTAMNGLTAVIDHENKRVSVEFSETLPPRISVWRPMLGCVQLPVGAGVDAIAHLSGPVPLERPRQDDEPWKTLAPTNGSSGNTALDEVIDGAFRGSEFNTTFGRDAFTTAILIATPDEIIAERYIEGYTHQTSQRTWSVAKSITATVIGAAVQQGKFDVKMPAPIPEWQNPLDPRRHITIENLLNMVSGLDSGRCQPVLDS